MYKEDVLLSRKKIAITKSGFHKNYNQEKKLLYELFFLTRSIVEKDTNLSKELRQYKYIYSYTRVYNVLCCKFYLLQI